MITKKEMLTVVIPTFKRTNLLRHLLEDLFDQTYLPNELIIVDGDPSTAEVISLLRQFDFPEKMVVKYVPSNYGNAPFQRHLGVAAADNSEWLIFIDDDIRIAQKDAFEKLILPFKWADSDIVGISPLIVFPSRPLPLQSEQRKGALDFLKSSSRIPPGGLTPSGDRVLPLETDNDYDSVQWLRGGLMIFRRASLDNKFFNEDVFALSHIRCGLGADDTYLSRLVGSEGGLLLARCVTVLHPDADVSQAYPADIMHLAYARAYSRRFLNDRYRLNKKSLFMDRWALVKNYLGNNFLNLKRIFPKAKKHDFVYAWGYFKGSVRGLIQQPSATILTPEINWLEAAQNALTGLIQIQ